MTEAELRNVVRDAIARHLGGQGASAAGGPPAPAGRPTAGALVSTPAGHASHVMLVLPAGEGACLIEPSVPCTHCGYCKSYGH